MFLSVIICTYNPVISSLRKVLDALKEQSLPKKDWELIVVDNKSSADIMNSVDVSWHPFARMIREEKAGLTFARITGVSASGSDLIVFVDDDNVLDKNFLWLALEFSKSHPEVGCFSGRSKPLFETSPPAWLGETGIDLGCQDFGNEIHISNFAATGFRLKSYPEKAPIGTGMVILKKAFQKYIEDIQTNTHRLALGRKGNALTSGEDNDIILTVVKNGYEIAYVPELIVHHIIPSRRYSLSYLERMAYESNRSWVKVLHMHKICPWPPVSPRTVQLRRLKYWLTIKPWKNEVRMISYMERCGRIKGLSEIMQMENRTIY